MKTYFLLTKPGIIFGNAITAVGGFMLASRGQINGTLLSAMLMGICLIVASACVLNNYIDRAADEKMARTKNRPLAKKVISEKNALVFAAILGLAGMVVLVGWTNFLAAGAALVGFLVYVFPYSLLKYRTVHATLIGSIAGAMPPVVGYCAASHQLDLGAGLIFMLVALWQMPHFFAIALYRLEDYTAASIPVLPVKRGVQVTKVQMVFYVIAFALTALMFTFLGYTGIAYLSVVSLLSLFWLVLGIKGLFSGNEKVWARHMFRFSLLMIMGVCAMISFDVI